MDTDLFIWDRVALQTCLFKNIIIDRDPKFTSALWTNLDKYLGMEVSCSTAYQPQTVELAERMRQTLEDIIRKLLSHGLEIRDSDGFTHDWCTLISELELA
ncbi:hypothetical protein O181_111452 [Austropuccinia psidii MF-1]|uniref:Integrase catalytic domain-containing protein n=1 Tax=Austropuccinia psidii MF-1 TaxID=1389203 RepID=A0A9Q3JZY1_9BASI|nr:hypothetical protein [Austropuccinia psidii MF-1]